MIRNIIFLGPPGVGKGTQSKFIAKKWKIKHISSGDMFRAELSSNSPLGQKIKDIVNVGGYVPNDLVNEVVINFILNNKINESGFILDGYPRTINQAMFLEESNVKIDCVIYLDATDDIIIKRLSGRRLCPKCKTIYNINNYEYDYCEVDKEKLVIRKDDDPVHIKNRLILYNKETKPLIEYYKKNKKLISINANMNSDYVFDQINKKVFNGID